MFLYVANKKLERKVLLGSHLVSVLSSEELPAGFKVFGYFGGGGSGKTFLNCHRYTFSKELRACEEVLGFVPVVSVPAFQKGFIGVLGGADRQCVKIKQSKLSVVVSAVMVFAVVFSVVTFKPVIDGERTFVEVAVDVRNETVANFRKIGNAFGSLVSGKGSIGNKESLADSTTESSQSVSYEAENSETKSVTSEKNVSDFASLLNSGESVITEKANVSAAFYSTFTDKVVTKSEPWIVFPNSSNNTTSVQWEVLLDGESIYTSEVVSPGKSVQWDAFSSLAESARVDVVTSDKAGNVLGKSSMYVIKSD